MYFNKFEIINISRSKVSISKLFRLLKLYNNKNLFLAGINKYDVNTFRYFKVLNICNAQNKKSNNYKLQSKEALESSMCDVIKIRLK